MCLFAATKTPLQGVILKCMFACMLLAMGFVPSKVWAQPTGCLVDAGISPQEVCINDAFALGGSPTIPPALAGEVAHLEWSVVAGQMEVVFTPSAFVENPEVTINQMTTFKVELELNDGSVCSNEITLVPIAEPTLTIPDHIYECGEETSVAFSNLTPSNSVFMSYEVDWGDGTSTPYAWSELLAHTYEQTGGYVATVEATLGSCSNETTIDIFVGDVPETPLVVLDNTICSTTGLKVVWANLESYPWGTDYTLSIDGVVGVSGQVDASTSDTLYWEFQGAETCLDLFEDQTIVAEASNVCSTVPSLSVTELQVQIAPTASISLSGDSCAQLTFEVGEQTVCPDFFSYDWQVTSDGAEAALTTLSGSDQDATWVANAEPGTYEVVLTATSEGCGTDTDTAEFCVKMPSPTFWELDNVANGQFFHLCIGDSLHLGIDSLVAMCGEDLVLEWNVSSLGGSTSASSVEVNELSEFSHWHTFTQTGDFLITLNSSGGCGYVNLSATILVSQIGEPNLVLYDEGVIADTVMCIGDINTIVAELPVSELVDDVYDLTWSLLDDEGEPSTIAEFEVVGESTIEITSLAPGSFQVVLDVTSLCGTSSTSLDMTIEGPYDNNYLILDGNEGTSSDDFTDYVQCLDETLVLQYNAPWAAEVNVNSSVNNLIDIVSVDPPAIGNLEWLAAGDNTNFAIEYISQAGCEYYDSLRFRTVYLPEIHVFDPELVCGGEQALFQSEVIPGSSNTMVAFTWISVDNADSGIIGGDTLGVTTVDAFEAVPPCNDGLHVHATVTDGYGCVGVTPEPASIVPNCPLPPDVPNTLITCTAPGESVSVNLNALPTGGTWSGPANVTFEEDNSAATTLASADNNYLTLTYQITDDMGCVSSNSTCWIEAAQDETGECVVEELCEDPEACNFNFAPECGLLTGCVYDDSLAMADIGVDTLVFCQSYSSFGLHPLAPSMGTWSGPGVYSNDGIWGNSALLNLSVPGARMIYFEGGVGSCSSIDSVFVIVRELPQHDHVSYMAACHNSDLDFNFNASAEGGVCWSFNWYDQPLPPCGNETTWTVTETSFVRWQVVDSAGCFSEMVFEVEDWGAPNALAGEDTVLCVGTEPNVMTFEFGDPMALGCAPIDESWSGEGAVFDVATEIWENGNCIQPPTPWADSLWYFDGNEAGEYEWVLTVVDCHGCVDSDTLNISVIEPILPFIPDLSFCLEDSVAVISPQVGSCWSGPGLGDDNIFDPVQAGLGEHEMYVGFGEGNCATQDTVVAMVWPNPDPNILMNESAPCYGGAYVVCLDTLAEETTSWSTAWSFPDTTNAVEFDVLCFELTVLDEGFVTAVVTDTNGCSGLVFQEIAPVYYDGAIAPDTLDYCADGDLHPLLGAFPAGGSWSGTYVQDGSFFLASDTGMFETVYTYVSPEGCLSEDVTVVRVAEVPSPTILAPSMEVCLFEELTLQSDMDGVWAGYGIDSEGTVLVDAPGAYTYHRVVEFGACFGSDSVEITVWPLPEPNVLDMLEGNSSVACSDAPFTIELSELYLQSNNIVSAVAMGCDSVIAEFPSFTFIPQSSCEVAVTVSDVHGCQATESHTLSVPGPQPFDAGPPEVICLGTILELDGYIVPTCNEDELEWSGLCVDAEGTVTPDTVGLCIAELHVLDCYGCALVGQREILVLDVPTVEVEWEDTLVCAGQEVDMSVDVYGGNVSYQWVWGELGAIDAPDTPWVAVNETAMPLDFSVSVQAENLCGMNADTSTVVVKPTMPFTATYDDSPTPMEDAIVCTPVGMSYMADAPGAETWIWSDNMLQDSLIGNQAFFAIDSVSEATTFPLSVQAELVSNFCTAPLLWEITVVPQPEVSLNAGATLACGESLVPDISFDHDFGLAEWDWSGGELPDTFPDGWVIDAPGGTTLSLVVTSEYPDANCVSAASLELGVYPQAVSDMDLLTSNIACAPGGFVIKDVSIDATSIQWEMGGEVGTASIDDTLALTIPSVGSHDLTWISMGLGGCNDTLHVPELVQVVPSPSAAIASSLPWVVAWDWNGVDVEFNDVSSGGNNNNWMVDGMAFDSLVSLPLHFEEPGTYDILLTVFNEFQCQDTATAQFVILEELTVFMPTAFTPNGDDLNDVWIPVIAGDSRIDSYHLQVLSRSGQLMFETFSPEEGWDALDVPRAEKLEDVQNNVFLCVLRILPEASVVQPAPEWMEFTGHVMIVD